MEGRGHKHVTGRSVVSGLSHPCHPWFRSIFSAAFFSKVGNRQPPARHFIMEGDRRPRPGKDSPMKRASSDVALAVQLRTIWTIGSVGSLTDDELVERFVARTDTAESEAAFAALVERHGAMVLSVCKRIVQHDHDAHDAFQATFLVLARKAGSIPGRGATAAWLFGVARRVAVKARAGRAPATTTREPPRPAACPGRLCDDDERSGSRAGLRSLDRGDRHPARSTSHASYPPLFRGNRDRSDRSAGGMPSWHCALKTRPRPHSPATSARTPRLLSRRSHAGCLRRGPNVSECSHSSATG